MTRTYLKKITAGLTVLATAATMSGCSAGYTTENTASVLLIVAGVTPSPLASDVVVGGSGGQGGTVVADTATVAIAIRTKNPNAPISPSIPNAVIIERYEVSYRRADGRGVEGQDVPYRISGNITAPFDVKTSGVDPLVIEVVRAQAKLEPPLRNLRSSTGTTFGGALIVTMFADIVIHGRTISGQAVSGQGSLQIDFADYNSGT